jgi:uncharacterized membrane protein YcaP (DUF421 family)
VTLQETLSAIFGQGADLSASQMAARAVILFFVTLFFIRVSGRRSFGQHKPFDACVTVLLGAMLSRAVVGTSPIMATIVACACIVVLHRIVAYLCTVSASVDRLVNGKIRVLVLHGNVDVKALRKGLVTWPEIQQALRASARTDSLSSRYTVVLERNGDITVIDQIRDNLMREGSYR